MRGSRSVEAVCAVVVLFACGCTGDEDSTDSTEQAVSGSQAATADGGGVDGSADSDEPNAEISGVSAPLPPQADLVATTESGPLTVVQFIVPLDRQEATIAFYDDWTESQPDGFQRVEAECGGVSWQNAPEPGAERTIIAVLAPIAGDDFVTVTLTVGPAE